MLSLIVLALVALMLGRELLFLLLIQEAKEVVLVRLVLNLLFGFDALRLLILVGPCRGAASSVVPHLFLEFFEVIMAYSPPDFLHVFF